MGLPLERERRWELGRDEVYERELGSSLLGRWENSLRRMVQCGRSVDAKDYQNVLLKKEEKSTSHQRTRFKDRFKLLKLFAGHDELDVVFVCLWC